MTGEALQDDMLLSDVLEHIHHDLVSSAEKRTEDWEGLFQIESAEVELHVRIRRDSQVKGGIKAYVIDFGGSTSEAEEHSHKITVRLAPIHKTVPVGRAKKDPMMRGTSEPAKTDN